ncbi:MAG TPA: caspase family protein [Bacteroidales bacterium]|nr:caspase family protein [Bacteroidales bacterium]
MKKAILSLIIFSYTAMSFSQVSENRSGVQTFNITKKSTDQMPVSRAVKDETAPIITLQAPDIKTDAGRKSSSASVIVKGKAEDEGGIFEVIVNDVNAKVAIDGSFLAEIPLSSGQNAVTIRATDNSLNKSSYTFMYERIPEKIAEVAPVKPANRYTITLISPDKDALTTATDKFNLKACITATASLRRVMITRNGSFVNGFFANNIIKKESCDFLVDETISLRLGMNDLKIEVYADDDTVSKDVTVEYSLYAAKNYAVLIGNQNYDDPNIPELEEPVKDVTELSEVLIKDYNFLPDNVIILKNSTKAEIIGKLHELRSVITPLDNLLIFYAGHGFWDEGMGVGYWLPKDASKNNPVNWIPNTDLTNYLGAIKTKHTLLIADACFSGAIFKTRAIGENFATEMLYQLNSRKAITSGYMKEVPDQSVFFQYLVKNLKENTSDYLSAEELFAKMRPAVMNNSPTVPQFGTIQNVGDEGGDFIFIKRKQGK